MTCFNYERILDAHMQTYNISIKSNLILTTETIINLQKSALHSQYIFMKQAMLGGILQLHIYVTCYTNEEINQYVYVRFCLRIGR